MKILSLLLSLLLTSTTSYGTETTVIDMRGELAATDTAKVLPITNDVLFGNDDSPFSLTNSPYIRGECQVTYQMFPKILLGEY